MPRPYDMRQTIAIDASRATRAVKTGVEWYAYKLIEALAKVAPAAWKVELLVDRPWPTPYSLLPTPWSTTVLPWPPRYLWSQVRLAAHLQRTRPSLFFSPVHVLPFFASSPAVVTIHDVDYALHPEAYSAKGRAYLGLTTRWACRRATRILVPSEATKKNLVERFGARPERVVVTPLAPMVAGRPSDAAIADAKARHGLADPYLLFVGRMETKKNAARVVEAFRRVQATRPGTRLVMIGKPGRGYEAVRAAIDAAALGDRLLETGWLPGDDLASLMAGATAMVFPSLAEGFGIPVLDAFAVGTPILTSRGIATEEVAGGAALLVEPTSTDSIAQGMARLLDDPALRAELVRKGTERVAGFAWEKTARATVAAFEQILSS